MKHIPKNLVISRTDSIGDVILTLPLAGIIKAKFPDCRITFLGASYTKPIIECCPHVDEIWCWNEIEKESAETRNTLIKEAKIDTFIHVFPRKEIAKWIKKTKLANRIGTSHRMYHLTTCNRRVNFTRKKSDLHESQLSTKLLKPLIGDVPHYSLKELHEYIGFQTPTPSSSSIFNLLHTQKKKIILHAKSQGSAIEWGVDNFIQLAKELDSNKFEIYFTGTEKEGDLFREKIPNQENIHDLTGKMHLKELITFISKADAIVAASTGPLHLGGIQNILTIGLFAPQRPIHPGRWQPIGNQVKIIESEKIAVASQPLDINVRKLVEKLENLWL